MFFAQAQSCQGLNPSPDLHNLLSLRMLVSPLIIVQLFVHLL